MDKSNQNKYEKLFDEMLKQLNVQLLKYGQGVYRLFSSEKIVDNKTICQEAMDVVECLEGFIEDSFIKDLEEESQNYGLSDFKINIWGDVIEKCEAYKKGSLQGKKFVQDHQWEIDVLDALTSHCHEINLDYITSEKAEDGQIYYVTLSETYTKTIRIIAKSQENACEKAMEALNCGNVKCDEYLEDSTTVQAENTEEFESRYMYFDNLTLLDENGDEE